MDGGRLTDGDPLPEGGCLPETVHCLVMSLAFILFVSVSFQVAHLAVCNSFWYWP